MQAVWKGLVVAESADTVRVDGHRYFPAADVRSELLRESDTHTVCPYKGRASYFSLEHDGERCADAAWTYPHPAPWVRQIRGRLAFGDAVELRESA